MPSARAFVGRHTRLDEIPGLDGLKLHLAADVLDVWGDLQVVTRNPDAALPYWAVAWGGGLAIAHYLRDHPAIAVGRRVLDVGAGSGLCAIAAMRVGALAATAVDIDPFAAAATRLNARANGVRIDVVERDVRADEPPNVDLILAGDCWYEQSLASRMTAWLLRARQAGIDVLLGDPGRRYLPRAALTELATYDVRSTSDLEDLARRRASVYSLSG